MKQNSKLATPIERAPEHPEQGRPATGKAATRLRLEELEERIAPSAKLSLAPTVGH